MNKNNLIFAMLILLIVLSISCDKEEKTIEKILINGIVSDANHNKLDSVKITLEETCFMCMGALPIETKYSKDDIFKFEFTPQKEHSYHIYFEKNGYLKRTYYVDLNRETQDCNIIMERVIE